MIEENKVDQLRLLETDIKRLLVKADKVAHFFANKSKCFPLGRATMQIRAAQSALQAAHGFIKTAVEEVERELDAD